MDISTKTKPPYIVLDGPIHDTGEYTEITKTLILDNFGAYFALSPKQVESLITLKVFSK